MKKAFLFVVLWLISMHIYAQETIGKNMLSLNLGASFLSRQDIVFSPFIHSDFTILNFGLDFTREARLFQKIHFNYAHFDPMVTTPYEFTEYGEPEMAYPHSFNFVDLDYLLGIKIKTTEKSALTLGGLFTANIQAMNYVYGRFSNFGYYSSLGLGIFARDKFRVNEKNHLTATLQLPLIAWLSRSPYLVNDDEFIENISSHSGVKSLGNFIGDRNMVTWNKLQTFDVELKYTYSIDNKWEVGAAYDFEFIHASQPRNILSFRNALNLSGNFKF